jgi:uncharacterized protein YebE (UPF0316 family)
MTEIVRFLDMHPFYWPVFIVCARIVDVSLGTMRTICVVRGYRAAAACLGFCEVVVWVIAVSGVLRELSFIKIVAYGLGFALGNACGVWLEQKMALGMQLVLMISRGKAHAVAFGLRLAGFAVTEIPARGSRGDMALCFAVVARRRTATVVRIARAVDNRAITIVEDVRDTSLARHLTDVPATGWRALIKKK